MKVYTYRLDPPAVVEKACEVFGWPNFTTDGEQMYENCHFRTWDEARDALLLNADARMENRASDYENAKAELQRTTERLAEAASAAVRAREIRQ